jgi:hypothetical protein
MCPPPHCHATARCCSAPMMYCTVLYCLQVRRAGHQDGRGRARHRQGGRSSPLRPLLLPHACRASGVRRPHHMLLMPPLRTQPRACSPPPVCAPPRACACLRSRAPTACSSCPSRPTCLCRWRAVRLTTAPPSERRCCIRYMRWPPVWLRRTACSGSVCGAWCPGWSHCHSHGARIPRMLLAPGPPVAPARNPSHLVACVRRPCAGPGGRA